MVKICEREISIQIACHSVSFQAIFRRYLQNKVILVTPSLYHVTLATLLQASPSLAQTAERPFLLSCFLDHCSAAAEAEGHSAKKASAAVKAHRCCCCRDTISLKERPGHRLLARRSVCYPQNWVYLYLIYLCYKKSVQCCTNVPPTPSGDFSKNVAIHRQVSNQDILNTIAVSAELS